MMKKIIQGYIQVLPEEMEEIKAIMNGTFNAPYPFDAGKIINGVKFENGVCMTVSIDKETREITADLYDGDTRLSLANPMKLSDYFGEIMMQGLDGNLYQAQVVKEFEKGAANSWFKKTPEPNKEMREVTVTAFPYAMVNGKIQVPLDVTDVNQYVQDHFDNIRFEEPELDYDGTDFVVEYEGQEEENEKE